MHLASSRDLNGGPPLVEKLFSLVRLSAISSKAVFAVEISLKADWKKVISAELNGGDDSPIRTDGPAGLSRNQFPAQFSRVHTDCSYVSVLLGWVVWILFAGSAFGEVPSKGVQLRARHTAQYEARRQSFVVELDKIAGEFDQAADRDAAKLARECALPVPVTPLDLDQLPETILAPIDPKLPSQLRDLHERFRNLRIAFGKDLHDLARRAREDKEKALARSWIREAAFHNPDDNALRKSLGYQRDGERWSTPFAIEKRTKNFVWHEKFGWLHKDQVTRYEAGERFFMGKWRSAEKEALLRRDFKNAWIVETEHYTLKTNDSLERGVQLAVRLEQFYRYFLAAFPSLFPESTLFNDSASGSKPVKPRRYMVHVFHSSEEYVRELQKKQPNVAQSNGLYFPKDRIAYFFYDPEAGDGLYETMYHEASHQLLYENQSHPNALVGEQQDFWVVEGFACYFESFRREPAPPASGDPSHPRMHFARKRLLEENLHLPLMKLAAMGRATFQNADDRAVLQRRYSQSTGLAHFFLNYENGLYREPFLQHVRSVYQGGRKRPESLESLTGVTFDELDEQYKKYIKALDADVRARGGE